MRPLNGTSRYVVYVFSCPLHSTDYGKVSTGDLHSVYQKIMTLFRHHQTEHQAAIALQHSRVPHQINRPLFAPLIGHVTTHALYKMLDELEKSTRPEFNLRCKGVFQKTMGLPCATHCDIAWLQAQQSIRSMYVIIST